MEYQIIKVITEPKFLEKLTEFTAKNDILKSWQRIDRKAGNLHLSILTSMQDFQKILDGIEQICGRTSDTHIIVSSTSAVLSPAVKKIEKEEQKKALLKATLISREELYSKVTAGAKLNVNFLLLVLLSTVVAAIGLLENNVTVIIGAMMIAPLLGPNLAISLGTSLGDLKLVISALRVNIAGILLCFITSVLVGIIWPYGLASAQLMLRTDLSYDSLVLALASGAAAVLSLTAGLSEVLVGVMVSAALLPPLVTFGILLGGERFSLAFGAGLLFAINIVAINFVANITFVIKGIRPSRWYEKQKAKIATQRNVMFWTIMLLMLAVIIFLRHGLVFFI